MGLREQFLAMMRQRFLIPFLALLGLILAGCDSPKDMGPAPPFTLARVDSGTFSLAAQRGRGPVVVTFFATWCSPCRMELPHLIDLYRKHRSHGLQMVAVSQEPLSVLRPFVAEEKIPFPVLSDPNGIAFGPYGAQEIPRTVLVNRDGNLAAVLPGYDEEAFANLFIPMVEKAVQPQQASRGPDGLP